MALEKGDVNIKLDDMSTIFGHIRKERNVSFALDVMILFNIIFYLYRYAFLKKPTDCLGGSCLGSR